jgi:hypothetical protein
VNVTFTGLSAIPEPSSLSLLVVAMASTMAIRRKKSPNRE